MSNPPPHDLDTERATLGACLRSVESYNAVSAIVSGDDFYSTLHGELFHTIGNLYERGEPVDTAGFRRYMGSRATNDVLAGITSHVTALPAPSARVVAEYAVRRRLIAAADKLRSAAYDLSTEVPDVVTEAGRELDAVAMPVMTVEPGPDVDSFLAEQVEQDWLVPGFLERGDRVILTGPEGKGKSTLLRTVAVQMAAGILPFRHHLTCDPVRVMIVDCENSRAQTQRRLQPLREKAGSRLDPWNLIVNVRPQGLDLMHRSDRKWLEERIAANRPDVLITGPLYKLHSGDPTEEKPARAVALLLDSLRVRYGFALMLEAHQPHAFSGAAHRPLRPYGASLWTRWPEIGLGLVEVDGEWQLGQWRGLREERDGWPTVVAKGGQGNWPWVWGIARSEMRSA